MKREAYQRPSGHVRRCPFFSSVYPPMRRRISLIDPPARPPAGPPGSHSGDATRSCPVRYLSRTGSNYGIECFNFTRVDRQRVLSTNLDDGERKPTTILFGQPFCRILRDLIVPVQFWCSERQVIQIACESCAHRHAGVTQTRVMRFRPHDDVLDVGFQEIVEARPIIGADRCTDPLDDLRLHALRIPVVRLFVWRAPAFRSDHQATPHLAGSGRSVHRLDGWCRCRLCCGSIRRLS